MDKSCQHEIAERADRAYAAREEIQNVHESVALLQPQLNGDDHFAAAWRLSRALFFLGQERQAAAAGGASQALLDHQAVLGFHLAGAQAGRRAARSRPEQVEGHFWAGVNLALLAAIEHGFKAAIHALQAKRALERSIACDAAYHGAGPLRVLARLQDKAPRWLGGGKQPARANFEQAIAIAPTNTVTRIYFAELLLEAGELRRARIELEQVLNVPFDPDWAFEIRRDQFLARELLARCAGSNSGRLPK